ncbi:hypothetical protein [Corynebacterium caspium]|uniref:hypothetical protein n=1 Tax=Corynebacterium caspium TaxID=234828 RepID=UPI0003A65BF2|nr:hypothetical protein [Corynebacterium caspium]
MSRHFKFGNYQQFAYAKYMKHHLISTVTSSINADTELLIYFHNLQFEHVILPLPT